MTSYLTNEESSYLLIPKKYFSRYVLAYEVILSSLCAKVNQKSLLNFSDSQAVVESGVMSEGYFLLELLCKEDKKAYSLANLKTVWFPNAELKQSFLDSRYENFDVESLDCEVVTSVAGDINGQIFGITHPEAISKIDFVNMMMLEDGIMALVYTRLKEHPQSTALKEILKLKSERTKEHLVRALVGSGSNDEIDLIVLERFIELCLEHGIDEGWNPNQILCQLSALLPSNIVEEKKYKQWQALAQAFVNSENVPDKLFTDPEDGSIVLRSIILVLLNPELKYLSALKEQNTFEIGAQVYQVAKSFIELRSGYSLLSAEDRGKISEYREWIQNFNADLHNNELSPKSTRIGNESLIDTPAINAYQSELSTNNEVNERLFIKPNSLVETEFLVKSLDVLEGFQVFDIVGVTPNSGFKVNLLVSNTSSQLSIWLVDLRTSAGERKYKGKLALELIHLQSILEEGSRFEVDDFGVYLRLSGITSHGSDLRALLRKKLNKISKLKILNIRKTTFV